MSEERLEKFKGQALALDDGGYWKFDAFMGDEFRELIEECERARRAEEAQEYRHEKIIAAWDKDRSALATAKARVVELRIALVEWGQHRDDCGIAIGGPYCSCGLSAFRNKFWPTLLARTAAKTGEGAK
jgi:hypothetical protein